MFVPSLGFPLKWLRIGGDDCRIINPPNQFYVIQAFSAYEDVRRTMHPSFISFQRSSQETRANAVLIMYFFLPSSIYYFELQFNSSFSICQSENVQRPRCSLLFYEVTFQCLHACHDNVQRKYLGPFGPS